MTSVAKLIWIAKSFAASTIACTTVFDNSQLNLTVIDKGTCFLVMLLATSTLK